MQRGGFDAEATTPVIENTDRLDSSDADLTGSANHHRATAIFLKMKTPLANRLRAALLAGALAAAAPAFCADGQVTLNFVNAEIEAVVQALSQITGKNFIIDPRVKGTVNVVSGKTIPPTQAYTLLLSALRMQGFTAVESDGIVKIVPEAEAKTLANPVVSDAAVALGGDRIITKVFAPRNASVAQLLSALKPLVPPSNSITADTGSNTLVITDYANNIARLSRVIALLDVPYDDEPKVIALRHASAIDLANLMTRMYGQVSAETHRRVVITSDPRTNSLVVKTDNVVTLAKVASMAMSLDQPTSTAGNIHVIYLKNAEATRLAQTLRGIVSGESTPLVAAATPLSSTAAPPIGSAPGTTGTPMGQTFAPSAAPQGSMGGPGATGAGFIQADVANNALIITAPDVVYNNLRRVVDMLDTRRAQVHIEALIVELSAARASEWGVQWQNFSGAKSDGVAVLGGTNFSTGGANIIELIQNIATASTTGALGIARGLNIGVIKGSSGGLPNIGVLARFLETGAKGNILSTPSLLTLDNEEARILVGQNVPIVTGSYAQTGAAATVSPFQTFERRDIGTQLRIKPQISQGGTVRLQIFQEASSLDPATVNSSQGPITNKRSIESTIIVDDNDIVVLGGLIQDSYGRGEEKVPVLGDIPILGSLFRYETRTRNKTNLMVFLQPRIIRSAEENREFTASRYDYVIGEQLRTGADAKLMPGEAPPPVLRPFEQQSPNVSQAAPPPAANPAAAAPVPR
jgi:general secretion pathway protein D